MNDSHVHQKTNSTLADFYPLLSIFFSIVLITVMQQWYFGWHAREAMRVFMSVFFLVFGAFKVSKLSDFARAYAEYDLVAKHFYVYGYIYPFIELSLGLAYLFDMMPLFVNSITFVLMGVSALGVLRKLLKKEQIMCACLGTVFKIPMTYVTLAEDLLMAVMALMMLFVAY